jgi:hypothetical protein
MHETVELLHQEWLEAKDLGFAALKSKLSAQNIPTKPQRQAEVIKLDGLPPSGIFHTVYKFHLSHFSYGCTRPIFKPAKVENEKLRFSCNAAIALP